MSCLNNTDPAVASCYDRGNCTAQGCICTDSVYESSLFCEKTKYDVYAGADYAIYIVLLILQVPIIIVVISELFWDLRKSKSITWRKPVVIAKAVLLLYSGTLVGTASQRIHEYLNRDADDKLVTAIITLLLGVTLALCYILSAIGWLSMVLSAKSLEKSQLSKYQMYLYGVLIVGAPVYAVTTILGTVIKLDDGLRLSFVFISSGIAAIMLLSVLCGSTFHLIKVLRWVRPLRSKSSLFRKIAMKTNWLVALNVGFLITFVMVVVNVILSKPTLKQSLAVYAIQSVTNWALSVGFYLLLENYLFDRNGKFTPLNVFSGRGRSAGDSGTSGGATSLRTTKAVSTMAIDSPRASSTSSTLNSSQTQS